MMTTHEAMDRLTESLIREVLLHMGEDSTTPENEEHVNNPVLRTMLASRVQGWLNSRLGIMPNDIEAPPYNYANHKRNLSQCDNRPVYQTRLLRGESK